MPNLTYLAVQMPVDNHMLFGKTRKENTHRVNRWSQLVYKEGVFDFKLLF